MSNEIVNSVTTSPTAARSAARLPTLQALGSVGRRVVPVITIFGALLLLWEGSKFLFGISDQRLPHVGDIFAVLFTRTQGGNGPLVLESMLNNSLATFGVAVSGFVLGTLLGVLLAVLFMNTRWLEQSLMPYVIGSQTVPILAIAPMVVVGLGRFGAPDWLPKAVVAAYLTFFPVTISMLRGLRSVSPDALTLMRSYAAHPLMVFTKLRLPASLPYLFTGLKIAATAAVIGAIVAELPSAATRGIGTVIIQAAQYYNSRPPMLFAAILFAALIGLVFFGAVVLAERLVLGKRRVQS